jgi:hypothetical protein
LFKVAISKTSSETRGAFCPFLGLMYPYSAVMTAEKLSLVILCKLETAIRAARRE